MTPTDTMRFLPDGRPPTEADLRHAADFDPGVAQCLALHQNGDLTRDQSLIGAILYLVDANCRLQKALVTATLRQRTEYILGPKEAP